MPEVSSALNRVAAFQAESRALLRRDAWCLRSVDPRRLDVLKPETLAYDPGRQNQNLRRCPGLQDSRVDTRPGLWHKHSRQTTVITPDLQLTSDRSSSSSDACEPQQHPSMSTTYYTEILTQTKALKQEPLTYTSFN